MPIPPVSRRYSRRYAPAERQAIAQEVKKLLEQGIIRESSSPWCSPVVLVRKKSSEYRFCVDYRELNRVTKKDVYPLPRIDDAIDCLAGAQYFSSLDLKQGFYQCGVREEDKEKTGFITNDGLYEFNRMPFGLTGAPATFERLMDTVLRGRKWHSCLVYLDDVCVYGRTWEEHNERLGDVLRCLDDASLSLNLKKCHLAQTELQLLGHTISTQGVLPDPDKVAAVKNSQTPTCLRALRSFIGLCSFYRRFIPDFAKIARPLHSLMQKDSAFEWTEEREAAFQRLKLALTSPPLLAHFDQTKPVTVHSDASGYGIGLILTQKRETDGAAAVVAYASRTLTKAEMNYSTTEKECLGVVWSTKVFRPYMYGRPVTVVTDHNALCHLMSAREPAGRLARWALRLQEFDITITYKAGRRHADADCLSRYPLTTVASLTMDHDQPAPLSMGTREIASKQRDDQRLRTLFEKAEHNPAYEVHDEVLYKRNFNPAGRKHLLVLPKSVREEALTAAHAEPQAGHMGLAKTYGRLAQRYYWPGMYRDATKFVYNCLDCQRRGRAIGPVPNLQHMNTPAEPFHTVGIDLAMFNPSRKGNRQVVTAIDHLSKYLVAEPLPNGTAEEIANFLVNRVILQHGTPRVLVSDRGKAFLSERSTESAKRTTERRPHTAPKLTDCASAPTIPSRTC